MRTHVLMLRGLHRAWSWSPTLSNISSGWHLTTSSQPTPNLSRSPCTQHMRTLLARPVRSATGVPGLPQIRTLAGPATAGVLGSARRGGQDESGGMDACICSTMGGGSPST
ncbi:uncharacterized protein B0H18DRAFT_1045932 [Fomitopsis serialis]|uniref:uncharacterized protein n=1 Tax=Fomitopsis serialis TaxID=139415 RepID=UPI002008DEBE|nr:uncharacterized protein B0H18DRAFT_1045932 [Neoantrodia serialis]KAH9914357.1 hypothetical protein B0H18DRAFT_1045932 [Neoantrodia serialis]